jgi:hypothetical protein
VLVGESETIEVDKTAENKDAAEDSVRFVTQRAGQASTWQHISKHKIRETKIVLLRFKTIS